MQGASNFVLCWSGLGFLRIFCISNLQHIVTPYIKVRGVCSPMLYLPNICMQCCVPPDFSGWTSEKLTHLGMFENMATLYLLQLPLSIIKDGWIRGLPQSLTVLVITGELR